LILSIPNLKKDKRLLRSWAEWVATLTIRMRSMFSPVKETFSPFRLNLIGRFLLHFPKWFKLLTGVFIKVSKSKRARASDSWRKFLDRAMRS
jgi:hypothetical protein